MNYQTRGPGEPSQASVYEGAPTVNQPSPESLAHERWLFSLDLDDSVSMR